MVMTQSEYNHILDDYVDNDEEFGGRNKFITDYDSAKRKARSHMDRILREKCGFDVEKLKSVMGNKGEGARRFNSWLEKNQYVPGMR